MNLEKHSEVISDVDKSKIIWDQVNFPLCLAPMVGLSHVVIRQIIQDYMPKGVKTLWPTEMLNSRRLPKEDFSKTPETLRLPSENFLIPQILGNEEIPIQESVKKLIDWGAHGVDINMGCPVQKALKHNYGVALMGDPEYAFNVVRMATKNSAVPVSVKLRALNSNKTKEELLYFVKGLIEAGAAWICLHPRTAEQKRRDSADWSQIRYLKENVSVPIIGNGDIQTSSDVWEMKKQTGCDLVMSGRGLVARPWMVWQLAEEMGLSYNETNNSSAPRTRLEEGQEYGHVLRKFIILGRRYFGESLTLRKLAFYVRMTSPWLLYGQTLLGLVAKAKNLEELDSSIVKFFSHPQEMLQKTELRI